MKTGFNMEKEVSRWPWFWEDKSSYTKYTNQWVWEISEGDLKFLYSMN